MILVCAIFNVTLNVPMLSLVEVKPMFSLAEVNAIHLCSKTKILHNERNHITNCMHEEQIIAYVKLIPIQVISFLLNVTIETF